MDRAGRRRWPRGGEQRLLVAPTDALGSPIELRKGVERLDAPAIAPMDRGSCSRRWRKTTGRSSSSAATARVRRASRARSSTTSCRSSSTRTAWSAAIGEARHRRSHLYELTPGRTRRRQAPGARGSSTTTPSGRSRLNTYGPLSGDGTKLLVVAERDGNTVSLERGVYLMDLSARVSVGGSQEPRRGESRGGTRTARERQAPVRADCHGGGEGHQDISAGRAYAHEKALFDFDSKHITRPGNRLAAEYLFNAYASFGYTPDTSGSRRGMHFGGRTANVLATLKGTVNPELVYVVSSHYDSVAIGPGADDDTSGTAALLEAARALAGHPMPATIVFASFTGEEGGLLGSREYVRQAVANGVKIVGALNNDMIGWANDHRLDNTIRYSNPGSATSSTRRRSSSAT